MEEQCSNCLNFYIDKANKESIRHIGECLNCDSNRSEQHDFSNSEDED